MAKSFKQNNDEGIGAYISKDTISLAIEKIDAEARAVEDDGDDLAPTEAAEQEFKGASTRGLREGLTRMSTIVKIENVEKLKYISFHTRKPIKKIVNDAFEAYIKEYEKNYGKITEQDL